MVSGWRYRGLSVIGTFLLTGVVLTVANHTLPQRLIFENGVPYLSRLSPEVVTNGYLLIAFVTTMVVMLGALWPLFKPHPRRILDTILLVEKRVVIAVLSLAAIGYFDYSFRLPRTTLVLMALLMVVVLPLWFVWIRQQTPGTERAILVGDDPQAMADIWNELDQELLGYVSPILRRPFEETTADGGQLTPKETAQPDSGSSLERLAGLARLEEVIVEQDIDTAFLAFASSDRAEFFATLDICDKHGVNAKVHREHVDTVLTESIGEGAIVDVDLEPLDLQDYVLKRVFDILFSGFGLVAMAPVMVVIMMAIKADDGGSLFYEQERTAEFGKTFTVYKFRTMFPEGETPEPVSDAQNDRITRVGRILRRTHLDEIPQLLSILTGEMSVVGPRAVWRKEEIILQSETETWQQRWFVKPGLTGLAQIRENTSEDPEEKLRSDLEYIRRQTFWFDMKIVIRQIWMVLGDVTDVVWSSEVDEE